MTIMVIVIIINFMLMSKKNPNTEHFRLFTFKTSEDIDIIACLLLPKVLNRQLMVADDSG